MGQVLKDRTMPATTTFCCSGPTRPGTLFRHEMPFVLSACGQSRTRMAIRPLSLIKVVAVPGDP